MVYTHFIDPTQLPQQETFSLTALALSWGGGGGGGERGSRGARAGIGVGWGGEERDL